MQKIYLASASERRADLLKQIGLEFEVVKAHINEEFEEHELPHEIVMRLAKEKAEAAIKRIKEKQGIVIAADTIVVLDAEIIGKPRSMAGSERMLRRLSGQRHEVLTGFAIIRLEDGKTVIDYESTDVEFRHLKPKEMFEYSRKNESRDAAGGYMIQGVAAKFVRSIEGEYSNVVGLPLCRISELLLHEFDLK